MLTSAASDSTTERFTLDGKVKTLSPPFTGAALHRIAGNPASLVSNGKEVPNDDEPFEIKRDQKFYSKHHLAQPERIPAEQVMPGGPPGVDPGPVEHHRHTEPVTESRVDPGPVEHNRHTEPVADNRTFDSTTFKG